MSSMSVRIHTLPPDDAFPSDADIRQVVTDLVRLRPSSSQPDTAPGRLWRLTTARSGDRLDVFVDGSAYLDFGSLTVVGIAVSVGDTDVEPEHASAAAPDQSVPVLTAAARVGACTYIRRSYVLGGERWEICARNRAWITTVTVARWLAAGERLEAPGPRLLQVVELGPRGVTDPPPGFAVTDAAADSYAPEPGQVFIRRPVLAEVHRQRVWGPPARWIEECIWKAQPWLADPDARGDTTTEG
jgi:hypothetical protein